MQIKATMSYHLTPVSMAIISKSTNNTCGCQGEGVGWTGQFGVRSELLRLERMGDEILLYRTGNYVQSLAMEHGVM